jgi:hypothetical protein
LAKVETREESRQLCRYLSLKIRTIRPIIQSVNQVLLHRPFPGATTCIVIGQPEADLVTELARYRHVLWLTDSNSAQTVRTHRVAKSFQRVLVDELPADGIETVLTQFIGYDARHLPSLYVMNGVQDRNTTAYSTVIDAIHEAFQSHHVARVTRQKDGFTWQKHLLQNVSAFVQRRLPAAWEGALHGQPAFVCGAGPSLDVTAPRLAAIADRGVVFAADSALRALARHGISIDFAVSIDAAKQPAKCLAPDSLPERVVLASVSPPAWCDALPIDRCFFVSGRQVTEDWLATQGVVRTATAAQENCGSTALELARFLGCAPIYLFGLDLAVDSANPASRHNAAADATIYTNSGFNPAQQLPTVPGNYAARVPTFAAGDWRALDERLAEWPAGLVFNVNDRGARYRNTTLVHPDQFVPNTPTTIKNTLLAHLATLETAAPNALDTVRSKMNVVATRAAQLPSPLRAALAAKSPETVAEIFKTFLVDRDRAQVFRYTHIA